MHQNPRPRSKVPVPSLPDRPRLLAYLRVISVQSLLFVASYGICNQLASLRSSHHALYFSWELQLPFVPWMVYPYMSLGPVFLCPLFLCGPDALRAINKAFTSALAVAVPAFLVFPAKLGFQRPKHVEGYDTIFQFMYAIDPPHNLVPSLHIALSTIIFCAISHDSMLRWVKKASVTWLVLLCCSVVLVRQHHVADVVAGLALGFAAYRWVYLRNQTRKNRAVSA